MANSKPVKNLFTGKEYASIKECQEYEFVPPGLIRRILNGEADYSGTMYDFVYIEKEQREVGRVVKIVELDLVFLSVQQCAEYVGCHPTEIFACLNPDNGRKSAKGYTFDYA